MPFVVRYPFEIKPHTVVEDIVLLAWNDGTLYIHYTGLWRRSSANVKLKRFNIGIYVHRERIDNTVFRPGTTMSCGHIGPKGG